MATIDQRLSMSKIDTEKMSKEEKFMTATGMTFYNEEHEKNEWYVPGGAAMGETDSVEPEEVEEKKEELEPQVPGQTTEEHQDTETTPTEETPLVQEVANQLLGTEMSGLVPNAIETEDTVVDEEEELPGSEFEVETV